MRDWQWIADRSPLSRNCSTILARLGSRRPAKVVVALRAIGIRRLPSGAFHDVAKVPSAWITARNGLSSATRSVGHVAKVQIIAMPLPFSGSARVCARTGTCAEQRRLHLWRTAAGSAVVGVRHQRSASQLGTRRLDLDEASGQNDFDPVMGH